MSLNIDIGVKSGQVKEAIKDVGILNKTLKDTGNIEVSPGKEGLSETSAILKEISEDIRRLKGLSQSGEQQGGLLKKEQFKEAEILTNRIGDNFGKYTKEVVRARSELAKLVDEKKKLVAVDSSRSPESPDSYIKRQERLSSIDSEIEAKRKHLSEKEKMEAKARELDRRATDYSNRIGGFGENQEPSKGFNAKKLLGYSTALVGGLSIMSFLSESMNKAANVSGGRADLAMRGGVGADKATFGYTPTEALAISDEINRRTGYSKGQLSVMSEVAKKFSREMGVDAGATAGYIGGTYQATGIKATEYREQLRLLKDTATALGQRGRIEDILHNNQQIVAGIVRGRGGREMTAGEMAGISGLQMALWAEKGMIGKGDSGANILSAIDRSIRGGGQTTGQQLFLLNALGGDKINSMTIRDRWELGKKMSSGLTVGNLKSSLDYSDKLAGAYGMSGENAKYFAMRNLKEVFGLNEFQTEAIFDPKFRKRLDLLASGKDSKQADAFLRDILKEPGAVASLKEFEGKSAVTSHRQTLANMESSQLDVGNAVLPYVDKFKDAVAGSIKELEKGNIAGAIIKGLKDNPIGQLMVGSLIVNGAMSAGGNPVAAAAAGAGLIAIGKEGLKAGVKWGSRALAVPGAAYAGYKAGEWLEDRYIHGGIGSWAYDKLHPEDSTNKGFEALTDAINNLNETLKMQPAHKVDVSVTADRGMRVAARGPGQ